MHKNFSRFVIAVVFVLMLSACQTLGFDVPAVESPKMKTVADEVRQLYQAAGITVPQKGATATTPATIDPVVFAQTGDRLVFTACNQYFDAIVKADKRLKMTKADVTAVGTAAAVITTLAQATPKQIGIVAAAFGLGAVAIDNIEQHAFATPYPTQTRGLVLKALATYKQSSAPESVKSLPDAADQIAGYAVLCTYSGIAELSEEAITKAVPTDTSKSVPLFSDAERAQYLQPVVSMLGLPAGTQLTDNDYVALTVIADPSTTNTTVLDAVAKTFSTILPAATVTSNIYDSSSHTKNVSTTNALWSILSGLVRANTNFATQVNNMKSAAAGGNPPPADKHKQPVIGIV